MLLTKVDNEVTLIRQSRCIFMTYVYSRACVASIFRTYYTFKIAQGPDVAFNIIVMGLAAAAELSIGVVVSCLPVLPRFVRHFVPRITRSSSSHPASTLGASHWGRFAHKLACILGRAPPPDKDDSGGRSTTVEPPTDSNIVEQESEREYVTIYLYELDSLDDSNLNKSLPPIPA